MKATAKTIQANAVKTVTFRLASVKNGAFTTVRSRVESAVKRQPRSISLSSARRQAETFRKASGTSSSMKLQGLSHAG